MAQPPLPLFGASVFHVEAGRRRAGLGVPVAGPLQRVGHFLGHVGLVVLGQHFGGAERAVRLQRAQRHHALPFAEQIGQDAGIADRDGGGAIGDAEAHRRACALADMLDAAGLDQPAEPEGAAVMRRLGGQVGGGEEEHHVVAERRQHQRRGGTQAEAAGKKQNKAAVLAGHQRFALGSMAASRRRARPMRDQASTENTVPTSTASA